MIEWIGQNAWWLTAAGVVMFFLGLVVVLCLAVLMPADHFVRVQDPHVHAGRHPLLRLALRVARNLAGLALLAAGLVMAVPMVPGPGVLFMLLGVSLTDLPGKRALIRYVISRPRILRPINRLRTRYGRPPLLLPRLGPRS